MKKNLRIVMMACLMILSGTAVAQKTILMPQQAFENLAAWLTANDYVATSSKKQYSKGYVVSYDYAVPVRKAKPDLQPGFARQQQDCLLFHDQEEGLRL